MLSNKQFILLRHATEPITQIVRRTKLSPVYGNIELSMVFSLPTRGNIVFGQTHLDEELGIIKLCPIKLNNTYTLIPNVALLKSGQISFNNSYNLINRGNLILSPSIVLLNNYDLKSLLSGILNSRYIGTMNFELLSSLFSESLTLESILFILSILQSQNFTLEIDKEKIFTLEL